MNKLLLTLTFSVVLPLCGAAAAQAKPPVAPKVDPKASRKEIRVEARNIAAEVRAPLTPAELEIAQRVHVGNLPCEHGGVVALQADPAAPGFFNLRARNVNYRVSPEETTTGAIRLEDKAAGVVWLQLANKSMLMNQKLGQRLNDGCMSPSQEQVAQAMLKAPPASVLDAKPVVAIEGATK